MSDFKKVSVKLEKLFENLVQAEQWKEIGDFAKDLVKTRTRKGSGVAQQGGTSSRLKPLTSAYKKRRKMMRLSSETTANKSNLTKTGEMLDNITVQPVKDGVELGFSSSKLSERADAVTKKGRPFFNLNKAELWKVNKLIKDAIKVSIKKQGW